MRIPHRCLDFVAQISKHSANHQRKKVVLSFSNENNLQSCMCGLVPPQMEVEEIMGAFLKLFSQCE